MRKAIRMCECEMEFESEQEDFLILTTFPSSTSDETRFFLKHFHRQNI